jgi:hypothetical protein
MAAQPLRARITRALSVVTAGALIASISLTSTAFADSPNSKKLSIDDRNRLASAAASGATRVTMLFATVESATASVARSLGSLGATVRKQDADVGYIRADVPTDKVDLAAKLPGVVASELDQVFDLPRPDAGEGAAPEQLPPDNTTPAQNAYMPTRDTGAPQFVAANPTWDGRGVTIGILDTGIDVGHWALQTTTTGERKIIDWISYTDPTTDGDPSWIRMNSTVTVSGGTFSVGTAPNVQTWTGAPDGTWRFGTFNEDNVPFARPDGTAAAEYRATCTNRPVTPPTTPPTFESGGDLNRNGICGETFAFLWDGFQNGFVWRDSDADGSFADEVGMREYKKDFAIGEYGHDNAATAVRESVPFVTQIDASAGYVSLGVVSGAHGTHVAGIAAGNKLFRNSSGTLVGDATGAAPGAQIVSLRVCLFTSGCTAHALTEGMIYAAKNANVDVISMSIGGLPSINDGNNARAILYNRLIDKWGAQIFLSAGNSGPGLNTIGDPAVTTKAMAIGAYWTKDSVFANYGNTAVSDEALHDFSSRGPREDGGLKPEVVAPGNATSSIPTWQNGSCLSTPNCAPGLGMFNGTSMAAPQASGAAALLVSAAKQSEVSHQPEQLRQALRSSARFFPGYQAYEQGFGLISVGGAWSLLAQGIKTAEISSKVATNTKLSSLLATPGFGTGIYDREPVALAAGATSYTRTYTFTRQDGGSATYDLSWLGNDGTFALPAGVSRLTFDKNKPATLAITVTPGAAGVHSAILRLDDAATVGVDYATMNTIVVTSATLNSGNSYRATIAGSAKRFEAGQPKVFFTVPDGTTAMRMTLRVIDGRVNATALHPYGVPLTAPSQAIPLTTGPATVSRVLTTGPIPGTWQVVSAASRAAVPATSTYEVSYEAYKVTLDPATWTNDPTTVNTPYTQEFTATNDFAASTTVQTGSSFVSVRERTATITAGAARQSHDIVVPAGTQNLQVTITDSTDLGADLDLYLYNCTDAAAGCVQVRSGTTASATESVSFPNPPAGLWRAEVDAFAVPTGSTTYKLTDIFTDNSTATGYGSVTVPDNTATARAAGASWTFVATGTAKRAAGEGRFLRASVAVRLDSATGPILGSATVIFANVTAAPAP